MPHMLSVLDLFVDFVLPGGMPGRAEDIDALWAPTFPRSIYTVKRI